MKKSTGAILVLIIIILLGVIGVGGYFFIQKNNDTNKEIGDLKNIVTNLKKSAENAANNQEADDIQTDTTTAKTMKEISVQYTYEVEDEDGNTRVTNLYLANDGTFGYFGEVGGNTGSYAIEGDKVILNVIFSHGGGVGLNVVKEQKTLTINEDESLETNDLFVNENDPETITLKKVSNSISNFDIRTNIRGSIGTGPEYSITYNY